MDNQDIQITIAEANDILFFAEITFVAIQRLHQHSEAEVWTISSGWVQPPSD